MAGRVTMGASKILPATHALLHVRPPDASRDEPAWLCDVGFGAGPLEPLRLIDGEEAVQDGWGFRLRRGRTVTTWSPNTAEWELHQRGPDGWVQRHTFVLDEVFRIDFEVGNHYVSTSARSPFTTRPFAQRFAPDSLRVLDGRALKITRPDGTAEARTLDPEDLPRTLEEEFGIALEDKDRVRLTEVVRA